MNVLVGIVESFNDATETGKMIVSFPSLDNRVETVTYTSPYYRMNSGGMVAIPEIGTEILALHNTNPNDGESLFYFLSCVISEKYRGGSDEFLQNPSPGKQSRARINPNFTPFNNNDTKAKIYAKDGTPVTQAFTNTAGAGLYIHRDFEKVPIANDVTLKSEGGNEVNVGSLGIQISNEEGDSVVLTGATKNDMYAKRGLYIETTGPQEYKCVNSDINMRILEGGDVNIENNSAGLRSLGKWFGNIRLKSRFRNIDLVGGSPTSNVNIITPGANIQVDGLGNIKILSTGELNFNTFGSMNFTSNTGDINLTSVLGKINLFGGIGINTQSISYMKNGIPEAFIPVAQYGLVDNEFLHDTPTPDALAAIAAAVIAASPPSITANDYGDPVGAI